MGIKDNNEQRSLDEINSTIEFNGTQRTSQKFLAFLGPGLLVAAIWIQEIGLHQCKVALHQCKVAHNLVIPYYLSF